MRIPYAFVARAASTLLAAACGGGSGDDVDDVTDAAGDDTGDDAQPITDAPIPDGAIDAIVLTSPAFAEGEEIPPLHSCYGADVSPELAWFGGPTAQSYAVVLKDLTNMLVHSVIYDVPGTATGLPAEVDNDYAPADVPGAHQPLAWENVTRGYAGPCPGNQHTYEFRVFALDVATLPGASMSTTRAEAVALIDLHAIGQGALSGTFTPPSATSESR